MLAPVQRLRELQHARRLISEVEVAHRARAILDRADLPSLDLVVFLKERGFEGGRLVRAASSFGRAVAAEYRAVYGVEPLRVERWVEHLQQKRLVVEYLEMDRPLVERVYAGWSL